MSRRFSAVVLAAALAAGMATRAQAQQPPPYPYAQQPTMGPPPGTDLPSYYEAAQSKRTIGMVLTFAGVALIGTGVALAVIGKNELYDNHDCYGCLNGYQAGAIASLVGGLAGLGVGIPFW